MVLTVTRLDRSLPAHAARTKRVEFKLRPMGYYMRVLLEEWDERPLSDLISFSRDYGELLRPARPDATPVDNPGWREADLLGPSSTAPIELEVALDDGTADCLVREELGELREELDDSDSDAGAKRRVAEHLDRTSAIVAVRVLASDTDNGLAAAHPVLAYYAQRQRVMFQADAEGFYEGEELIVETG
jgi:hypothetical protein